MEFSPVKETNGDKSMLFVFYMDVYYPSCKIDEKIWAIGCIFKWEKNIYLLC
jgi:hypothetical protein